MITRIETKVIVCGKTIHLTPYFFFVGGFIFAHFDPKTIKMSLRFTFYCTLQTNVDLKDFLCAYICANGPEVSKLEELNACLFFSAGRVGSVPQHLAF